jgi:hypothetical protein
MKRHKQAAKDWSEQDQTSRKVKQEPKPINEASHQPDDLEEALYGTFPASDPVAWESKFTAGRPSKEK